MIRGKAHCIAETKTMWQVGEELKKRRIRIFFKKKEIIYKRRRLMKLTNSGGVAGTE